MHEVHFDDGSLRLWSSKELLVAGWFEAPTIEEMREVGKAGRLLAARYPKGAALANVIVSGTPRFSDEVRDEAITIAKGRTFRKGSCHVVLVGGLGGAAARAFMSMVLLVGMKALGRNAAPSKVFGEIPDAAHWLAPVLGEGWTSREIAEVFREISEPRSYSKSLP